MKIDLTGTLYESQKKSIAEYDRLKDSGDIPAAKRKAGEIAKIFRQIADMNPASRKENLERAMKWEIAAGIRPAGKPSKPAAKKASSGETAEEENESEISAKVESLITTSNVKWSDIGGLDYVKQLMMETVVIAGLKKPDSIKPWKGILLFGPPGTGKTLLAAAAASSGRRRSYSGSSSGSSWSSGSSSSSSSWSSGSSSWGWGGGSGGGGGASSSW